MYRELGHSIALLLLSVLVAACTARTEISSYTDPAAASRSKIGSMIVVGVGVPLDERQALEAAGIEALNERGVSGITGSSVLPPTRQMSDEEVVEALVASGAEALLLVGALERGKTEAYIPQTYHPGQTSGTAQTFGNTTYFNMSQSPGYTTGGYSVSKPTARHSALLIDITSGQSLWAAEGSSRGNAFADYTDLGSSMASEAVAALARDGLI